MKQFLLFFAFVAVCAQPLFAQQETPPAGGPDLTLHFGIYHGGSGRSIVRQFQDSGFGEEGTSSAFFGPEENPVRSEGSVQLGVLFPIRQNFRAKGLLLYRDTEVEGTAIFFEPLLLNTSVLTAAALGYLPLPSRLFRLGVGPAVHVASSKLEYGGAEQAEENGAKVGFALEGGFSFPANKRFYADLQAQYMFVGKTDLGSYNYTATITENSTQSKSVDLSSTKLSTFTLSLGVGYRLYKM
ncbi:outer membrane beta-barrel protein [Pontibacter roseus]|uniref:outer membrane beta-barrel protein n=1 Tax=Pontibacter roseus TaxID=336989 RepID=UPI0003740250|nr:outer membrane beta-barrel protein [Pontibacter roseus]